MAKEPGLGDMLIVHGFNASGSIQQLGQIGGGPNLLPFTGIDKSAMERKGALLSARMEMTTFFDSDTVTPALHQKLAALPRTDVILTYGHTTQLGWPAASLVGKQINYDLTRGDDGGLMFTVSAQSNGYTVDWGKQLTAGVRTDTAATLGTGVDTLASASFGGQAYLQVGAFVGTDATVKIQDSADNVSFADVAGLAFTQITGGAPLAERIAVSNTTTIRRYVRAVTVTTGGFTSLAFSVNFAKNEVAGVQF